MNNGRFLRVYDCDDADGTPLISYTELGKIAVASCQTPKCDDFRRGNVQRPGVLKDGFEPR